MPEEQDVTEALLAHRQDRYPEAETNFARALAIYREVYDGQHTRVGIALSNLASVHLAAGAHAKAEALFREHAPASNYEFELKHKVIIDRFGRYPHRNAILGRASTEEELEFLQQPGSGF